MTKTLKIKTALPVKAWDLFSYLVSSPKKPCLLPLLPPLAICSRQWLFSISSRFRVTIVILRVYLRETRGKPVAFLKIGVIISVNQAILYVSAVLSLKWEHSKLVRGLGVIVKLINKMGALHLEKVLGFRWHQIICTSSRENTFRIALFSDGNPWLTFVQLFDAGWFPASCFCSPHPPVADLTVVSAMTLSRCYAFFRLSLVWWCTGCCHMATVQRCHMDHKRKWNGEVYYLQVLQKDQKR